MSKVAVVYWSSTGNTEEMAKAVVLGAEEKGAEVTLYNTSEFNDSMIDGFDAFAFGCPAMGAEELEEDEFEPLFASCEDKLAGKKVALFGSYGWGDGEWMQSWEERCKEHGIDLACDSVMCCETPDDEGVDNCKALGAALA